MTPRRRASLIWWTALALCLAPAAALVWFFAADDLGADPINRAIRYLGEWALRFLVIGIALTPVRRFTGWTWLSRFRRMAGVAAFGYVCLHLSAYVAADQFFDWHAIWADIVKRPYITVGMAAFLLLVPLAATSTNSMVKRLGGKRWMKLHRLVYLIVPLGAVHYFMLVKADETWPLFYAGLTAVFLLSRVAYTLRQRGAASAGGSRGGVRG